jgi:ribonuclease R
MHGDQVLVEITNIRPDGRAEGRIVRPVRRAHPSVVGIFHHGSRHNYVTPLDSKIAHEIVIPRGEERPEATWGQPPRLSTGRRPGSHVSTDRASLERQPRAAAATQSGRGSKHRVLGEEAAPRSDWSDLENVVVDVEITDWPSATQNPRGRVIEILGYEDDFGVDVEIIIRKFHLPHRFPEDALAEAEAIEPIISSAELRKRRDFCDLPIVTIDGETARDFDDAVLVTRLADGNF